MSHLGCNSNTFSCDFKDFLESFDGLKDTDAPAMWARLSSLGWGLLHTNMDT